MGVAHPVLTGDKPAEFHHDHCPVRYNYKYNNMDSLQFQTKLQHPLLDDFDQLLAGMRPPSSFEAHVPLSPSYKPFA